MSKFFNGKVILLISPEKWDHLFVSKHHYATHLAARGSKVYFLNPPSSISKGLISPTGFNNLFVLDYNGFPRGISFYPQFLQRNLFKIKLQELQRLCKAKFDIIWSFDTSVFFDFKILSDKICLSHIVDLNMEYGFRSAARTADICLCSSNFIKNRVINFNNHVYKINHGFNKQISNRVINLPGNNAIKCFYAGNLKIPYIDWKLLEILISNNKEVDFIFAGNWSDKATLLKKYNNFHYLGVINSNDLQDHFKASDILILCYLSQKFKKQLANPHKLMEYFGSGKVVVATWSEEYKNLENLMLMSKTPEEFLMYFEKAKSQLNIYNNHELIKKRIDFAMDNTYDRQIERIEILLNEQFKDK